MYTLLIVDDEPLIREGLANGFDWASLGFTVCGTAADGEEAYALAASCAPDALITDISMAGMNGIGLLKKLRENGFALPVVIISGYDDFEYARQSIRYGAVEYLLKPVNEDALRSVFAAIRQTLDLRLSERGGTKPDRGAAAAARAAMPRNALLAFLQGGAELSDQVCSFLAPWGFQKGLPCAAALLSAAPDLLTALENDAAHYSWRDGGPGAEAKPVPFPLRTRDALLLLFPLERGAAGSLLSGFLDGAGRAADGGRAYCILDGGAFEELPAVYRRMTAEPFRFYYLTPWKVSDPPEPGAAGGAEKLALPDPEEVCALIRGGDGGKLARAFSGMADQMRDCRPNPDAAAVQFSEFYTRSAALLQDLCGALPALPFCELYRLLCDCPDVSEFAGVFQKHMLALAEAAEAAARSKPDVIEEIRRYIDAHYQDDLSLSSVAERFYLNASYLSALFSRKMGCTFSDYLEKVRLQEAALLLRTTRLSVSEVGAAAGYQSARYFCRLFRERYLCTPTEYRLRPLREDQP